MDIAEEIRRVRLQEERLRFSAFDAHTAWDIGLWLRKAGEAKKSPLVVDIQLWTLPLLSFALPGATPENFDWARRKRNLVAHFHRSSYAIGRMLAHDKKTLQDLGALPERDYAAHGGGFPILVQGTGCVGAVVVSGLPQRDDHMLVVCALAHGLKADLKDLMLE